MGCCCLQVTFQAESITEARCLYDQLTPFTPILLALTASSPIWRGYLTNVDCRWSVISGSVDDRTEEELGHEPLKHDKFRIPKSRYDSINSYLSPHAAKYNDIKLVKDESIYKSLLENGVDSLLAQHVAHLFIRDPLVLFKEKLDLDEEFDVDNFENIQSMNWQTMRFKPPPIKLNKNELNESEIGWRVEFRPMELQFTDFENTAFCAFVILLTRAIQTFGLNFLMPMSKVDVNMRRAQKRNACLSEKFYFRKNVEESEMSESEANCELVELSIDEIMNGNGEFRGVLSFIRDYVGLVELEPLTQCYFKQFLKLIEKRANGEFMTPASYIRKFVMNHSKYKNDSVVDEDVSYDLLWHVYLIQNGKVSFPEMLFKANC